ncbi:hypothetical protein HMPREF3190_00984 [Umbribacter vaginalis]|nr:hypothetical protein HMPREF3190_00984 [Coriobacteriales bacterium DNF00809]
MLRHPSIKSVAAPFNSSILSLIQYVSAVRVYRRIHSVAFRFVSSMRSVLSVRAARV